MDGILMRKIWNSAQAILLALALFVAQATPASAQFTDQRNYGGTSGGSANAQTLTIANMPAVIPQGVPIRFIPGFANTTTATLTISGGAGAINLCKPSPAGPTVLSGGELQTTQTVEVVYNGTCLLITSSVDSTATSLVVPPQGRLTLTSGAPVMTAGVSAATTAYYSPYVGNQIPIYNGTRFVVFSFAELTLTIPSSRLANLLYDACVFSNSGTATVVFGPAWSNSTPGSTTRGTGAGTAELSRLNGIWVNAVQISAVNGASTFTIAANLCTYVGTFYMDGTNGQVSVLYAFGQSRKIGIWNAYNRVPATMLVGDATASWTQGATRPANNNSANSGVALSGLPEESVLVSYNAIAVSNGVGVGVGWGSTSVMSGYFTIADLGSGNVGNVSGFYVSAPFTGLVTATALENGTAVQRGGQQNMQMRIQWRN